MPDRYRKKPVVVEAQQLPRGTSVEPLEAIADWCDGNICWGPRATPDGILIVTLEGTMRADRGDWIIRGVAGEFYPCKPDIFDATYEPAGDGVTDEERIERLTEAARDALELLEHGAGGGRDRFSSTILGLRGALEA